MEITRAVPIQSKRPLEANGLGLVRSFESPASEVGITYVQGRVSVQVTITRCVVRAVQSSRHRTHKITGNGPNDYATPGVQRARRWVNGETFPIDNVGESRYEVRGGQLRAALLGENPEQ